MPWERQNAGRMGEKVNIGEFSDALPRLFMKVLSEIFKYVVKVAYIKMRDYFKLFSRDFMIFR